MCGWICIKVHRSLEQLSQSLEMRNDFVIEGAIGCNRACRSVCLTLFYMPGRCRFCLRQRFRWSFLLKFLFARLLSFHLALCAHHTVRSVLDLVSISFNVASLELIAFKLQILSDEPDLRGWMDGSL